MSRHLKLCSLLIPFVVSVICFCYWLSGFDFNERSDVALWCFILCSLSSFAIFISSYDYHLDLECKQERFLARQTKQVKS